MTEEHPFTELDRNEDQWAMLIVRYSCYSCLTFLAWDWLTGIPFEVRFIWRKSTARSTKFLYAFPRYFGLLSSICNAIAVSHIHAKYYVDRMSCERWYGFQKLTISVMLLALEILLMVRVFALFDRKRHMAIFLFASLAAKTLIVFVLGAHTIRNMDFEVACLTESVPWTAVCVSALDVLVQTVIWSMTLYKHLITHLKHGWQNIPLLSLVTRDGSVAFVLLVVIFVVLLKDAMTVKGNVSEQRMRLNDIAFPYVNIPNHHCFHSLPFHLAF
ncbi:hypothetical protein BDZ97DRAFT_1336690 [Flammula alnicola]|nr:hypothetical protein BDZ97DRAFT_1336690 [Flammula alnicola]